MEKWARCAPLLVSWFVDALVATTYPFPPKGAPHESTSANVKTTTAKT